MPDPTREDMIVAVRSAEALAEHHVRYWSDHPQSSAYLGAAVQLDGIRRALREIEAGGWRPINEHPTEPMAVEFYHGNWPGPEQYDRQKRTHGYWSGNAWIDDGTNHEVFEWPDMVDNHPTHWRRQCAPPTTSDGRKP